eukprot:TRINITY_DN46662_c0_g1_i1.p1 TRINITY_DN46662_c0_g1~~TRINITY_DN46662_c0_g1_i1.p1  ORF type:complete len:222 (-),score=31.24 TRINITY_DN46662_c0_g1_i1:112-756(-)
MTWMNRYYNQTLQKMADIKEFSWADEQSVLKLWNQCIHEGSVLDNLATTCSLFQTEHVKLLEWLDDLSLWQTKGPAQLVNTGMARPLVQDLLQAIQVFKKGQQISELVRLHFAHAETIIPFETLIGIIGQDEKGSWNGNSISPYGANLILIIYECGDKGVRVQMYQNEERIGCQGGPGGSCLLDDFIDQLQNRLNQFEGFDNLCGVETRECKVE